MSEDRIAREWAWAVRALGLKARLRKSSMAGEIAGVPLEIDRSQGTRITAVGRFPDGFALSFETLRTRVGDLLGAGDLVTGDPDFDALIRVEAKPPRTHARAILWSATRAEIRRLIGAGVTIARNTVEYRHHEPLDDSQKIIAVAKEVAELAAMLSLEPRNVPDRLFDNTFDPQPDVRLACLEALLAEYPDHHSTVSAVRACLGDSDPRVRLVAALDDRSGDRGKKVLETLIHDAGLPATLRTRAVYAIARRMKREDSQGGRVSLADEGLAGALSEPRERGTVSIVSGSKPKKRRR